jgi:hypothetical protein
MATKATITFSQAGVQPPVYVTSSLSGWTTLEMNVEEDKMASDNLVFSKEFIDVAEGDHQYKIRLGEDHWILDESKDTGNMIHGPFLPILLTIGSYRRSRHPQQRRPRQSRERNQLHELRLRCHDRTGANVRHALLEGVPRATHKATRQS